MSSVLILSDCNGILTTTLLQANSALNSEIRRKNQLISKLQGKADRQFFEGRTKISQKENSDPPRSPLTLGELFFTHFLHSVN
jgi:hypothetical protein